VYSNEAGWIINVPLKDSYWIRIHSVSQIERPKRK
jgi:hypothetical protein